MTTQQEKAHSKAHSKVKGLLYAYRMNLDMYEADCLKTDVFNKETQQYFAGKAAVYKSAIEDLKEILNEMEA